jgi:hypothetical protein
MSWKCKYCGGNVDFELSATITGNDVINRFSNFNFKMNDACFTDVSIGVQCQCYTGYYRGFSELSTALKDNAVWED